MFGATGAFNQLKLSLDQIWQLESKPTNGIVGFLRARMISFAMVIGLGFVLLVSLAVEALASGAGQHIAINLGSFGEGSLTVITTLLSMLLSITIFAAIFKFLPDAKVRWKEILRGSLFTAIVFAIGRTGIGYYIGNSSITTGFGGAGSLVALLVWTNYSSQPRGYSEQSLSGSWQSKITILYDQEIRPYVLESRPKKTKSMREFQATNS